MKRTQNRNFHEERPSAGLRLFAAIRFTEPFRDAVLDCQHCLKQGAASGNFTRPENLHMTLAFIGEVKDPAPALRAVKSVSFAPFSLTLTEGGTFGGSLYWLGAESGGRAETLASSLRSALKREGVPFDTKPFQSHITLGREVMLSAPVRMKVPAASMTVSHISLMKSERINGKLVYTEIHG